MKENNFPDNRIENINENFIIPELEKKPMNQILINPKNITDQYFIEPELKGNKIVVKADTCHFCPVLLALLFCIICSLSLMLFDPGAWYIIAINILILIIFIICCYTKTFIKLEVIKGESNNEVNINAYNCFHCLYKKLKYTNINFYIGLVNDNLGANKNIYRLFIMKNYNNLEEIDLETSNVKIVPVKFYYYFDNIWRYKDIGIEKKLNEFVGNPNYECPFQFNINKYMSIWLSEEEKNVFYPPLNDIYSKNIYSQYLKFCDNFFCYYIERPFSKITSDILRIDFIYSKNFDILFIGLVNNNEKSYANTFEFNMATIDIFILQKISYQETGFNLKVVFKDKSEQLIYSLKKGTQEDLKGLVFILNERLKGNNDIVRANEITEDNLPPLPSTNIK